MVAMDVNNRHFSLITEYIEFENLSKREILVE